MIRKRHGTDIILSEKCVTNIINYDTKKHVPDIIKEIYIYLMKLIA